MALNVRRMKRRILLEGFNNNGQAVSREIWAGKTDNSGSDQVLDDIVVQNWDAVFTVRYSSFTIMVDNRWRITYPVPSKQAAGSNRILYGGNALKLGNDSLVYRMNAVITPDPNERIYNVERIREIGFREGFSFYGRATS